MSRNQMIESLESRRLLSASWGGWVDVSAAVDHGNVAHYAKKASSTSSLVGTYKGTAAGVVNSANHTTDNDKVTVVVKSYAAKKSGNTCTVNVTYTDSYGSFSFNGTALKIPGANGFSISTGTVAAFNLVLQSKGHAAGTFAGALGKNSINVVFKPDFHHT